jgi:predicted nuclease of restriction endonuclease-like (RecB) superfamily
VWSVRELKRQINSLYYERSGYSNDKKKLAKMVRAKVEQSEPSQVIRDPYVFEFMGLKPQDVMDESKFEQQLLSQLQNFLLELGHGFCFEARQKRILIGEKIYYVNLVFYHRLLRCHVLVELKTDGFSHEHIGQLNTYVNWYRDNQMSKGDNPPVGILLCTEKDRALVEYALAGLSEKLFVSKYQVELPEKELMRKMVKTSFKKLKR